MTSGRKKTKATPSTVVLDAVRSHSVEALAEALDSGADPNASDRGGLTPLMEAVLGGQAAMVGALLDRGADVNAADRGGWTSLHYAARDFQVEIAESLLSRGAHIDPRDSDGNTPLWRAVFRSRGKGEMIQLLLRSGADRSLKNNHGVSAEDLARTIANYDVARFLK